MRPTTFTCLGQSQAFLAASLSSAKIDNVHGFNPNGPRSEPSFKGWLDGYAMLCMPASQACRLRNDLSAGPGHQNWINSRQINIVSASSLLSFGRRASARAISCRANKLARPPDNRVRCFSSSITAHGGSKLTVIALLVLRIVSVMLTRCLPLLRAFNPQ
jgi:hypothetical protein